MIRQILFEMKITFKSIKTLIYMIFVFLYTITILFGIAAKDTGLLTYQQEADYNVADARWIYAGIPVRTDEQLRAVPYWSRLLDIQEALSNGDIKTYLYYQLTDSIENYEFYENVYAQLLEKNRAQWADGLFDDQDELIKMRQEIGWEIVPYTLTDQHLNSLYNHAYYTQLFKQNLRYNYALYNSGETMASIYRVDAITSLMHYQSKILPSITWIITILLLMDSMFRDFTNGTIKMLITLPKDRGRYILVKMISSWLSTIIVLLIPIVVVFALLFLRHGFTSANYPVLADIRGFGSFKSNFEYAKLYTDYNQSTYAPQPYGIAQVVNGLYASDYDRGTFATLFLEAPSFSLSVIPLWKLILFATVPYLLIIMFLNAFGVMMSILIRNRNGFIGVSALLIGLSMLIGSQFFGQSWLMFNPMSLSNGFALVEGILPLTTLSALIVLPIYSFVCMLIAMVRFKKLDIH